MSLDIQALQKQVASLTTQVSELTALLVQHTPSEPVLIDPNLSGSELTRVLLKEGYKDILCLLTNSAAKGISKHNAKVAFISRYADKQELLFTGNHTHSWDYAHPIDAYGNLHTYASYIASLKKPKLTGTELARALCKAGHLGFKAYVSDVNDLRAIDAERLLYINKYYSDRPNYNFSAMTYAVPLTADNVPALASVDEYVSLYM